MISGRRRSFTWIRLTAATVVTLGVFVQAYLIASYLFGAADAKSAHEVVGGAVHGVEVLVFLAALGASWGSWRTVGLALALPLIGTIQVALGDRQALDAGGWVHGLHGLLALIVMVIATVIAHRDALALRPAAPSVS